MESLSLETLENIDPKEPKGYEKHLPIYTNVVSPADGNIHMDNIFSYWVYLWFVVYMFARISSIDSVLNKYFLKYCNPLLALIFALIGELALFVRLIYIWPNTITVVKYVVIMLLVRIWPIYELSDTKIQWKNDTIYLLCVFIAYNLYLAVKGTNMIEVYNETYNSIANNRNQTPMFYAVNIAIRWFSQKTGYTLPLAIRETFGIA